MAADVDATVALLVDRVQLHLDRFVDEMQKRIIIALAGVPGSGKSTVSAALACCLQAKGVPCMVVPMDGFHYTKKQLSAFPNPREAFLRRGAPFTFDVERLLVLVRTLRETPVTIDMAPPILAPGFDHARQDPVAEEIAVPLTTRVVIIEGNYLLLDQGRWRDVSDLVDDKWFVDTEPSVALSRLVARHVQTGMETTPEAAMVRARANDLLNSDLIRAHLITPDVRVFN
ncbi:hypothetical protein Sste5346_009547 [Sporothrix stenoceras]|uniref:Phosphoribulokinase/uridine kinase domain-containing protein n=1 Tax=Sporothrix stenoceras TaxID=5173 RepID=A0ABR3YJE5_9PEZI